MFTCHVITLTSNISSVLNEMAFVKKIQVRQNYAPWVSEGCKRDMNTRERAQEKAVASQEGEDWDEFRKIRNAVTRRVKKEKEDWMKTKMDRCEANSSTCWKNIMGWLGWATTGSPTRLYSGFRVETSPNKMANIMNEFYIQKVANIRAALPPPSVNPLSMLSSMLADCNTPEFTLQPVHPATVDKIITNLSNSKASGLDYIDTYIIKLVKNEILPSITHIINTSIESGVFPEIYKRSRIIPLLKDPKSDKMAPGSYRPVALLPVCSKILERVVYIQTRDHMSRNNLFHPNHHGFRANHSCSTAILQMYDSWLEAIEQQELVGLTLIDLSAAFDCVDVDLLLAKTRIYNFSRHTRQWIWSYMTGREQVTEIEGSSSSSLRVNVGVPQGSIQGPLLYVLYTNELPEVVHLLNCPHPNQQEQEQVHMPQYRLGDTECGALACR